MKQMTLPIEGGDLFEKLCSFDYLLEGFKAVKRNRGSPGVDRVTVDEFGCCFDEELMQLGKELWSWTYKPYPVRRVEIPKPGKDAGVRLLGVPCVRDRVVQATLKIILEPILDPLFSERSYGFRPGRSQRLAVESAQQIVNSEKEYVVDLDLSKFFDRVHHDRLISRLSLVILDNFRSLWAKKTREHAEDRGIQLVFLPPYSPDLNPIEYIWKSIKRVLSPMFIETVDHLKSVVKEVFEKLSSKTSFAKSWVKQFQIEL